MNRDVIVIGGGVVGCSIALRLAQGGAQVTVVERQKLGAEASRAAAGMLSPQTEAHEPGTFFDLCLRSRSLYRDFAGEVAALSGIDPHYRDEGTLVAILDAETETRSDEWTAWQIEAGLAVEKLTASELRRFEPSITQSAAGAIYLPNDHQIDNRLLMDALAVALKGCGVEVIEGQSVETITIEGSRVTGVQSPGAQLNAATIIVAAGCWSSHLLNPLGLNLAITPVRGQMLALNSQTLRHVLHSNQCYLVPRCDGRLLVGSTVECDGYNKMNTAGGLSALLVPALELVPALAACEILETWAGLRPDTPDHLPVIGESGIENLLLATGHFRNGILLAPITAHAIAEMVFRNHTPQEILPFSLKRFAAAI